MLMLLLLVCALDVASGAYRATTGYGAPGCVGTSLYTSFYDAPCAVGPVSACVDSGTTSRKEDCVDTYAPLVSATDHGSYVTSLTGSDCSSIAARGYAVRLGQCVAISPSLSVIWTCTSALGGSLKQVSYAGSSTCGSDPQTLSTRVAVCLTNNTLASCNGPISAAPAAAVPSVLLVVVVLALILLLSN